MNYFSLEFIAFFASVVTLYYLARPRYRIPLLLVASTLFYMAYVPKYIFILFSLITLDYSAGLLIERAQTKRAKKAWLAARNALSV